jgi:Flp pilus assembly protein TadG
MKRRCKRTEYRGTACVEAAVILPLLLLLVFGFIEIGFYLDSHQLLQDAARQGARAAVLLENSNAQVQAAVANSLNRSIGVSASAVTVQMFKLDQAGAAEYQVISLDENEQGQAVQVVVTVSYSEFNPPSNFLGLASGSLTSSAVMQRQDQAN